MKPLHILFEGHSLLPPRTGIGRSSEYLIRHLVSHPKIESISLVFSLFPMGSHWNDDLKVIRELGVAVSSYRIPLPFGWVMQCWSKLNRPQVDRWIPNVDLIHGLAHVLPSRSSAAGILTVHDTSLIDHPEWYPKTAKSFRTQILQGARKANRILVPSESVREKLVQTESSWESKIRVIPHDLHFPVQIIPPDSKAEVRRHSLHIEDPYFFWTGEINPRKNIPLLFSLLVALQRSGYPRLKLLLSGSLGFHSETILQEGRLLGLRIRTEQDLIQENLAGTDFDVLLYGFVSEEKLSLLYACAELFVFPSWDEGFGFPVLEAMSCGTPVLGSSLGSLPELCQDCAMLHDPHRGVTPYIESARSILENPALSERYRESGYRRQQFYRTANMIKRTFQAYEEVLSPPNDELAGNINR